MRFVVISSQDNNHLIAQNCVYIKTRNTYTKNRELCKLETCVKAQSLCLIDALYMFHSANSPLLNIVTLLGLKHKIWWKNPLVQRTQRALRTTWSYMHSLKEPYDLKNHVFAQNFNKNANERVIEKVSVMSAPKIKDGCMQDVQVPFYFYVFLVIFNINDYMRFFFKLTFSTPIDCITTQITGPFQST